MQNLSQVETNFPPFIVDNCLSTHLNHYTNPNLAIFSSLTETKSYVPISTCVFEHIITTNNLTNCEKLYYLLADSLALINKNEGGARATCLPSEEWAIRLGCSRSLVFTMQKSLEEKGYFIINKNFDKIGRNKRNLIIPTLPASVFDSLNDKYQNKIKKESLEEESLETERQLCNSSTKCRRSYFDKTQLFIKLNYNLLKAITSNKYLNSQQKVIWLGFYTRCYKNYMSPIIENANLNQYSNNIDFSFSLVASYKELAEYYSYNIKHLSKSIKALEEASFIKAQHFHIREKRNGNYVDEDYSNNQGSNSGGGDSCYYMQERRDKSLWKITLLLPDDFVYELEKQKDRANFDLSYSNPKVITTNNSVNSEAGQDYLSQESKPIDDSIDDSYIESVIEELDIEDNVEEQELLEEVISSKDGVKSDPPFAKSGLLLNKNLKQSFKSNLEDKPKVLFNKFLNKKKKPFSINLELIRQKIKELPKEKADKARKFAYSLTSKKLARGTAEGLNKHEMAKQLIIHAATWKPTKLGSISREKQIDTALSVAWRAIENGTWKAPLEWEKAQILEWEYKTYAQKYKDSGVLSEELTYLESSVKKLLKTNYVGLKYIIEKEWEYTGGFETSPNKSLVPVAEANNYQEHSSLVTHKKYRDLPPFPEEQEAYLSYSDLHPMGSINTNAENEEEYSATRILELPHIQDKQKYLKMKYLDVNNQMRITTIDDNEYLFKYKAVEYNSSEKEWSIVFDSANLESFIKDLNNGILRQNSNILVNNDLSNNLDRLTDSGKKGAYPLEQCEGSNIQAQKTLQIDNDIKTGCNKGYDTKTGFSIDKDTQIDQNYVVNQKKQVSLKEFLNTTPKGQKSLETDIDRVLSAIAKNL